MALDALTLNAIRSWVGSTEPSAADLEARYLLLGSVEAVALQVLRQRLADMLAEPGRYDVDGDASWSYEENIRSLRSSIATLQDLVGGGSSSGLSALTVGQMVRSDRPGR